MQQIPCKFCQVNVAQLHITRIENDKVYSIHVCPQCAHEHGLANPVQPSQISAWIEEASEAAQPVRDEEPGKEAVCPGCGWKYEQFRESGKMGCDRCYETFADHLSLFVSRIQRGREHIGKVPKRAGSRVRQVVSLRELKQELEEAVRREDFEAAARLRDRIKELAGKSKDGNENHKP